MNCNHCGHSAPVEELFCPNCGWELCKIELDMLTERIKHYRKDDDLRVAWLIHRAYINGYFYQKYDSFPEYGKAEFNMGQANFYRYNQIGELFVDYNGTPLISRSEKWTIGKLGALVILPISSINQLIERNIINFKMSYDELYTIAKEVKENKNKIPEKYCVQ